MLVNAAEKERPAFLMLVDVVVVGSSRVTLLLPRTLPCGSGMGEILAVASLPKSRRCRSPHLSNTDRSDDDAQPIHTSSKSLFCVVFMHIAT